MSTFASIDTDLLVARGPKGHPVPAHARALGFYLVAKAGATRVAHLSRGFCDATEEAGITQAQATSALDFLRQWPRGNPLVRDITVADGNAIKVHLRPAPPRGAWVQLHQTLAAAPLPFWVKRAVLVLRAAWHSGHGHGALYRFNLHSKAELGVYECAPKEWASGTPSKATQLRLAKEFEQAAVASGLAEVVKERTPRRARLVTLHDDDQGVINAFVAALKTSTQEPSTPRSYKRHTPTLAPSSDKCHTPSLAPRDEEPSTPRNRSLAPRYARGPYVDSFYRNLCRPPSSPPALGSPPNPLQGSNPNPPQGSNPPWKRSVSVFRRLGNTGGIAMLKRFSRLGSKPKARAAPAEALPCPPRRPARPVRPSGPPAVQAAPLTSEGPSRPSAPRSPEAVEAFGHWFPRDLRHIEKFAGLEDSRIGDTALLARLNRRFTPDITAADVAKAAIQTSWKVRDKCLAVLLELSDFTPVVREHAKRRQSQARLLDHEQHYRWAWTQLVVFGPWHFGPNPEPLDETHTLTLLYLARHDGARVQRSGRTVEIRLPDPDPSLLDEFREAYLTHYLAETQPPIPPGLLEYFK
jgi:hypothetical protein